MGYTHHWKHDEFTPLNWSVITSAVEILLQGSDLVQFESDDSGEPEISGQCIRFNGIGEDGHETFYLSNSADEYSFCKTNRKPYDAVCVAVLLIAQQTSPSFNWWSDGDNESALLTDALALINDAGLCSIRGIS